MSVLFRFLPRTAVWCPAFSLESYENTGRWCFASLPAFDASWADTLSLRLTLHSTLSGALDFLHISVYLLSCRQVWSGMAIQPEPAVGEAGPRSVRMTWGTECNVEVIVWFIKLKARLIMKKTGIYPLEPH